MAGSQIRALSRGLLSLFESKEDYWLISDSQKYDVEMPKGNSIGSIFYRIVKGLADKKCLDVLTTKKPSLGFCL